MTTITRKKLFLAVIEGQSIDGIYRAGKQLPGLHVSFCHEDEEPAFVVITPVELYELRIGFTRTPAAVLAALRDVDELVEMFRE